VSRRKALFVNQGFTARIDGLPKEESGAIETVDKVVPDGHAEMPFVGVKLTAMATSHL